MYHAITGTIADDYQGNPKIKITKDCPQITVDCYSTGMTNSELVRYLMNIHGKELVILPVNELKELIRKSKED